jgi:hypothetical protein
MADRWKITVNDLDLELSKETEIAITLQIAKVGNANSRFGNMSNTINLPLSRKNREILKLDFNTENSLVYDKLNAVIYYNENELLKGICTVQNKTNTLQIVVYGGLFNLFDRLGDLTCEELDLPEILFTTDNFLNYDDEIAWLLTDCDNDENELKYGASKTNYIPTGSSSTLHRVYMNFYRPSIKLDYLFAEIIKYAGFIYEFKEYLPEGSLITEDYKPMLDENSTKYLIKE